MGLTPLLLSEENRQMVLMALAHLAVERPGWRMALLEIATVIDRPDAPMFTEFERLHAGPTLTVELFGTSTDGHTDECSGWFAGRMCDCGRFSR